MITLCRQGLSQAAPWPPPRAKRESLGQPRIAYFGRIDRAKGADLLRPAGILIARKRTAKAEVVN
jgi:hypothetical protein